ncbi:MAG: hypothetical protein K1X74_00650 [Pirellulales bacterium]|nr:hypothetical protein [Pirellulales bacterium]
MSDLARELSEALKTGDRPRLVDAIRKLRELLANVDLGKVLELLKQVLPLLEQIGLLPPSTPAAVAEIEAACAEALADEPTAQAIDLPTLLAIVKLVLELIRRFNPPQPQPQPAA